MEAFKFCMGIQSNSPTSDQFSDCFFSSSDHPFESALSSIVSSPAAAANPGDGVMLRELIGRLGNICSSPDYGTPPILSPFSGDPGFAERAAKNSLFGVNPSGKEKELGDSREGSSVSDQIPADCNGKKRKGSNRGKTAASLKNAAIGGSAAANEESSGKRSKKEVVSTTSCGNAEEPPKDYIHVRARRGQATDSHSLAERVRREKISERMKFLQDLVPGCNKVTGKAVMLDEIINYVQSLQRQVEFLSMKLSTVNPRMDFNMEALLSKEIFQSRGTLPHGIYPLDSSSLQSLPFGYQHQHQHQNQNHQQFSQLHSNNNTSNDHTQFQLNPQAMLHRNPAIHLAAMDGFAESAQQISTFFEEDLQSVVQMGFGQIQQQPFQVSLASAQMKIEL